MVDQEASRLEFAADFGFQAALSTSQELSRAERSFDLAIDATGVSAVAQGLPKLVANGGGVLLFGVCPPQETIAVFPFEVFRRQLTIAGSHSLNHNIPEAIELIGQIGPQIDKLVSHRLPLADIPAAMSGALGKGTLKIQADITL
jgi:threonine dehydrogenase-like Zn-dependent dehydrogenase